MQEVRILVVDDNLMDARLCQMLLERHGFVVLQITDPRKAVDVMQNQKIDLLLVDIYLPHIDGFELISHAKSIQPHIAVLVMTGFATVQTGIQALQQGVDGLILKPFDNGERLVEAVQQALLLNRHKEDSARLKVLRPLFSITEALIAETDSGNLYKLILSSVESLFPGSCTCIYRCTINGDNLMCVAASEKAEHCNHGAFIQSFLHFSQHDEAVLVDDHNSELIGWRQTLGVKAGWSFMVVPVGQGATRFLFLAGRPQSMIAFTEADLDMFVLLARQAAIAVLNADLYEELRTTIRQVEESQRALIQAEKMAAVGRLIASVAHEINNPLQAIGNCLHLAGRKDLEITQRDAYLQTGRDELDRLKLTIRHMLDYYRLDSEVREPADVRDLVERTLELLNAQLSSHSIQVKTNFCEAITPLPMAKNQMQQVLMNLMLNAIDAASMNGSARTIWIDAEMQDDRLIISIEDSGPGVPAEYEHRIFEPFFSTKPDGMGLGLKVSHGIVEIHGGKLRLVPPNYGTGAKFQISLPYGV